MQNKTQNIISKVEKVQENNTNSIQENETVLKEIEYLLQCASVECGW